MERTAGVLGTLIFFFIRFATEAMFEVEKPGKEAYHAEGVAVASTGGSAAPAEESPSFLTADVTGGKSVAIKANSHDISKGGPNKIGPSRECHRPAAQPNPASLLQRHERRPAPWTHVAVQIFEVAAMMVPAPR